VFSIVGHDRLIDVAVALMNEALSDQYFINRKLYPNVDFFSGLVYRALGFPPQYFTVLFGIPRWLICGLSSVIVLGIGLPGTWHTGGRP